MTARWHDRISVDLNFLSLACVIFLVPPLAPLRPAAVTLYVIFYLYGLARRRSYQSNSQCACGYLVKLQFDCIVCLIRFAMWLPRTIIILAYVGELTLPMTLTAGSLTYLGVGLSLLILVELHLFLYLDKRRHFRAFFCTNCRYDLTGNESGRCPECGTNIGGMYAAHPDA